MRTANDVWKLVRNGLAIYGGYCLLSGTASKKLENSWNRIVDHTEEKLHEFVYGEPKEKVIEAEFEEVK